MNSFLGPYCYLLKQVHPVFFDAFTSFVPNIVLVVNASVGLIKLATLDWLQISF